MTSEARKATMMDCNAREEATAVHLAKYPTLDQGVDECL